ncbi:DUF5131 family protein [Olivibacter sp. LS-1]|uniref:DUF5131 family protein n=1 Tax=Olivibacter sp. LS-1 TaxID=2592345 RepID=UPI0011EA94A3|nr:DUF5131 family protein [Olivibacter sp. LS-1]QEL01611.1 DUF5131 family protein [Olivibacter sp. LS-1]
MENSKIERTHHTVNLWHGCVEVHEGCDNCYARVLNNRYHHENPHWGNKVPRLIIRKSFNDLLKFQKSAKDKGETHRVFVGSMMDIFEKSMPLVDGSGREIEGQDTGYLRDLLFQQITAGLYPNLLFLFLTKRPSNINKYIPDSWKSNAPANVMFGTSVVNQETANKMIPELLKVNGKRFLSCEPLLGEVNLSTWFEQCPKSKRIDGKGHSWLFDGDDPYVKCYYCGEYRDARTGRTIGDSFSLESPIHWVICGGESGHGARPMNPIWATNLRDQCFASGVPFFFKQWGEWVSEHHESVSHRDYQGAYQHSDAFVTYTEDKSDYYGQYMIKIGKKKAGNLLGGKEYKEFPII